MNVYTVTVMARAVLTVDADDDGQAGQLARRCVEACLEAASLPREVRGMEVETTVQAAAQHADRAA